MKLHNNKEAFYELIALVSDYYKIDPSLVEKDYFVTLLLRELAERIPALLFKGGTSLSKCHKIIDRFSEDIDLTLEENHLTQAPKKQMKSEIVEACKALELNILNIEDIRSRRDYNCYRIEYPIKHPALQIKPLLLVETTYINKSYPCETKYASSIIYDYLKENEKAYVIEKYDLSPFPIRVQALERTLVDKVFALCDYLIAERFERNSRHIYDISRLLERVELDSSLKELAARVREERKNGALCYSAKDGADVPSLLRAVAESTAYKKDYESTTEKLISKPHPYGEAVKALQKIIESGIFEF